MGGGSVVVRAAANQRRKGTQRVASALCEIGREVRPTCEKHSRFGEYRTKRVILEICDRMAEAICAGRFYQTLRDLLLADCRVARLQMGDAE